MEESGYSFRNDIIEEEYRSVREIKIRNEDVQSYWVFTKRLNLG